MTGVLQPGAPHDFLHLFMFVGLLVVTAVVFLLLVFNNREMRALRAELHELNLRVPNAGWFQAVENNREQLARWDESRLSKVEEQSAATTLRLAELLAEHHAFTGTERRSPHPTIPR
jgi:hypothetical protein